MKTIAVQRLDGIPSAHQQLIFEAMKACTIRERLAVCLYFMSELPLARHRLKDIDRELRLIFPPSQDGNGYMPDQYADFQASNVRYCFNAEKRDIKNASERLWRNPGKGFWENTEIGNRAALHVLYARGLRIEHGLSEFVPSEAPLPEKTKEFLERDSSGEHTPEAEPLAELQPHSENILAHFDCLISALPVIDAKRLPVNAAPSIQMMGRPDEIQQLMRSIMDRVALRQATLTVTFGESGWQVSVAGG